jgi:hypothetical protein
LRGDHAQKKDRADDDSKKSHPALGFGFDPDIDQRRIRSTGRSTGATTRSSGRTTGATVPGATTGRGRSTTPGFTTQPAGYSTYSQYTTALAFSVLAATNAVIISTDNAIESFISASSIAEFLMTP